MLPDILSIKSEIAERFNAAFKARVNMYLGVIGEAPRHLIKEGRRTCIVRPDRSVDESELKEAAAEFSFTFAEIPDLTPEARFARMDWAARHMAEQISKHSFEVIGSAVERVGNVVDGRGEPLSADMVLEMLDTIQLEFNPDGSHRPVTWVLPPAQRPRALEILRKLDEDPDYRRRHEELIAKKWMEWRDREAARKLVG